MNTISYEDLKARLEDNPDYFIPKTGITPEGKAIYKNIAKGSLLFPPIGIPYFGIKRFHNDMSQGKSLPHSIMNGLYTGLATYYSALADSTYVDNLRPDVMDEIELRDRVDPPKDIKEPKKRRTDTYYRTDEKYKLNKKIGSLDHTQNRSRFEQWYDKRLLDSYELRHGLANVFQKLSVPIRAMDKIASEEKGPLDFLYKYHPTKGLDQGRAYQYQKFMDDLKNTGRAYYDILASVGNFVTRNEDKSINESN